MWQVLKDVYKWFWKMFPYFWVASVVAIPYLSYRAKQEDFNCVDNVIMYAAVFIGAMGLMKENRRRGRR